MKESQTESPAKKYSRLFRKAGVFLAHSQFALALVPLREGEALALALGDTEKLTLFRDEMAQCEKRLRDEEESPKRLRS